MPKCQQSGRSKQLHEGRDPADPPPEQAEVERALGAILDHLKPKFDRKAARIAPRQRP